MSLPQKTARIRIRKIVAGGLGLGSLPDGMVVMVPGVLPGEEILLRAARQRKDFLEGELVKVEKASRQRITPPCPVAGRCGGCDFQHIRYEEQLRLKGRILKELLVRAKISEAPDLGHRLGPTLASPERLGYRQRIRLQADSSGRVGFYRHRSHRIEPVTECLLTCGPINAVLKDMRASDAFSRLAAQCISLELETSPEEAGVLVCFNFRRRPRAKDRSLAHELSLSSRLIRAVILAAADCAVPLRITRQSGPQGDATGSPLLVRRTLPSELTGKPLPLAWEFGSFSQVNSKQNERCVKLLLEWARVDSGTRVLDLHCGMGNFSLPLAACGAAVVGVDLKRAAIRSAAGNARNAGLDRCRFVQGPDVEKAKSLIQEGETFDLVLLDPPRVGCAAVIPLLPLLQAKKIIYLSCDPATLARDLRRLGRAGYAIEAVQPIDMFPQTHHIETMTLLRRRKENEAA